jgi:predicted outer membrane repeat protein
MYTGVNNDNCVLQDLLFTNNSAFKDGGAFLLTSANVFLTVTRCHFIQNTAGNSGTKTIQQF